MSTELRRVSSDDWKKLTTNRHQFSAPTLDAEAQQRLDAIFGVPTDLESAVTTIIEDVKTNGDVAVAQWTERIDGVKQATPKVDVATCEKAWQELPSDVRDALQLAFSRITKFHEYQKPTGILGTPDMHLRPTPLRAAGCYVPGGRAAYPSTVLMTTIPARVAGVKRIAITSPPSPDGGVHPGVAAAAHLCEVDEVLAIGGVQAIAALACGTETIAPVNTIVGPGNIFVTLAKRHVFGTVSIDGFAGPSEVLIIASEGANASWIAADLISQLEHDPLAWAVCITDSATLADEVDAAFTEQATNAARAGIIGSAAGRHGLLLLIPSISDAAELANGFAPEHLELQGEAAEALVDQIDCAGAVFVGGTSPVPIGDYIAGPNHTLPTGGAARFGGPLSVMDFIHWPSVSKVSAQSLAELSDAACVLANYEGLFGHTASISKRMSV